MPPGPGGENSARVPSRDTGFPQADASADYLRARRGRATRALAQRLRREPGDVGFILPYEEVVEALGYLGERAAGLRTLPLESVVGTVDRGRDFDRAFRPVNPRVRGRWERIATAMRRGEPFPPISVYRWARSTSSATATTACRWPARSAATSSRPA